MQKPLDNIFETLNIEKLEIQEVKEYQNYLQEILPHLLTPEQKIKVLISKVKLSQRVVELDFERIRLFNQGTEGEFENNVW